MTVSKHAALAAELEKGILSGKYGWEGGLPTTSELAQQWNMSVNTVKIALTVLETKDLIEKRGAGYYVNLIPTVMTKYVPPTHIRLHQREGYSENIGLIKRVSLPEHLAQKLNISPSEPVLYRVQISGELAEGIKKPLQISYRYYFLPLSEEEVQRMQNDTTYDPMWNKPEVIVELDCSDEVTPRLATEGERDLLSLPETTAVSNVFESIRDKASSNPLMATEIVLSPRTALIFHFSFLNHP
jgi:DNA-binding GntR family transcriptional regulator